jgi:precorrin-8X/cobalt-precorrin-8 methylmutase
VRKVDTSPAQNFGYLKDPAEIYRLSFAAIRGELDLAHIPPEFEPVVVRLVHAVADPSILPELRWSAGAVAAARSALAAGAPILADCEMVAHGITRARLAAGNDIICMLRDPHVAALAASQRTTRSAAAVELWRGRLDGAVVAIGNAPTALFRLLELVAEGASRPAAILGFPVGFVGAAEAKAALAGNALGLDFITLLGRRGGSPLAAAAVNALAAPEEAA